MQTLAVSKGLTTVC